jgi:hypothetical protein
LASRRATCALAVPGLTNKLAPGESLFTFAATCMSAAGYPSAAYSTSFVLSNLDGAIAISPTVSPWGAWGYPGATDALQERADQA